MNECKCQDPFAPVAIIGMAALFPKALGLKNYWRLLYHGVDAVGEVPESHWSAEDYYDPDPKKPDHVYCTRGGFLEPVSFDPVAFGIPPAAVAAIDTAQILGLIAAKRALEDAGYRSHEDFDAARTSVILGVTGTQELVIPLSSRLGHPLWRLALASEGIAPEKIAAVVDKIAASYPCWEENSFPGLLGNVVAGRIANRLNLGGTNCVVDAACASSMAALHLGLMELATGRSDLVLTGGVDTLNDIFMHMCFAKTWTLSKSGDAKPFSKDADGTVLGEGSGILLLKRLADARADGDRIYAVIKGMGASSDGKSQSIYAPRKEGQIKALQNAYQSCSIDPTSIDLVEAHGTGTRVGDQVEFQALCTVFGGGDKGMTRRCALGSVKSNIGHTKAAAGAAGLIKTALSLHHKVLPATLKASEPDPKLNVSQSPFHLCTRTRPWFSNAGRPRRAGVSAFGFGGSNFHVVLEEWQPNKQAAAWDGSVEIAALAADDKPALQRSLAQWRRFLESRPKPEEIAVRAAADRKAFDAGRTWRALAAWEPDAEADSACGLFTAALGALEKEDRTPVQSPAGIFFWGCGGRPGRLAFVFPGQGSQYLQMARDWVCVFPEAFDVFERADARFSGEDARLTDIVFPRPDDSNTAAEPQLLLQNTRIAQPAIGAASMAMLSVLQRFGIVPDAAAGHSYGELTALCAAGWISVDDFLDLSVQRGRLMADAARHHDDAGAMLAVNAPLTEIESMVTAMGLDIVLANRNTPVQGVLSGAGVAVDRAASECRRRGWRCKKLPVSAAFHSRFVEAAQKPFAAAVQKTPFNPTVVSVFSNTSGAPYPVQETEIRALLGCQMIRPVNFIQEIEALYESGVRTFLEVGPRSVMTGLINAILPQDAAVAFSVDSTGGRRNGLVDAARTICRLAALGHPAMLEHWENTPPPPPKPVLEIPILGANPKPARVWTAPLRAEKPAVAHPETVPAATAAAPAPQSIEPRKSEEKNQTMKDDNSLTSPGFAVEAFKAIQEGLKSIQKLQQTTAETHQKFLESQTAASRTLQKIIEQTQHLADSSVGKRPTAAESPGLAASDTAAETTPGPPPPSAEMSLKSAAAVPPDQTEALHEEASAPARTEEVAPENTQSADLEHPGLTQTLLTVVGELTGYPEEMLGLDMDIEADLGIDSIKRVEIFSAVEERVPDLPPVAPEEMGTLKTLGQIIEHLNRQAPAGPQIGRCTRQDPAAPEASAGEKNSATRLRQTLLTVVGELTGYPEEMLGLDMDIEADLGIDSIKRVEIFSAVEERVSDLPPVAPEAMGTLKTLGQIIEHLNRQAPAGPQIGRCTRQDPAAPEASAGEKNSAARLRQTLLTVVGELTGYPEEMLGLDMDIEADLGIDSIKRVEIFSAVEERVSDLPPVAPEEMGTLKTLGQIIEHLSTSSAGPVLSESAANQPSNAAVETVWPAVPDIDRHAVAVRPKAFCPGPGLNISAEAIIYMTEDPGGLAQAVAAALQERGCHARCITADAANSPETFVRPAAGWIFIGSDDEVYDGAALKTVFSFARQAAAGLAAAGKDCFLATISRLDGAFGFGEKEFCNPIQGGLAALAKTAAREWPSVWCRAFDVSPEWDDPAAVAEKIADELLKPHPEDPVEIGLSQNDRLVLELRPQPYTTTDAKKAVELGPADVVVVSGGARGVTAAALMPLARVSRAIFVLLGRSPQPDPEPEWMAGLDQEKEIKQAILDHQFSNGKVSPRQLQEAFQFQIAARQIRQTLTDLQRSGAQAFYYSVDVRNAPAVAEVLTAVRRQHGPIRAVIHGAGVLEDRFIRDKTPEQFARVFDTKVFGLQSLLKATRDDALRYLVLFSSVSARFGNPGQVDYAMANEVLNKIARQQQRLRPECRVTAVNWGPWNGGMVSPALKREFEKRGVTLIPLDTGAACLLYEMAFDGDAPVEIVVGDGLAPPAPKETPAANSVPEALCLMAERDVDLTQYPILADHVLGGKPVVPFALMAEWLGHVALHENPGLVLIGLNDMRLLKGIKLGGQKRRIRLMAGRLQPNGGDYQVPVEIRDGLQNGRDVIHAGAKAVLADTLSAPPTFEMPNFKDARAYPKSIRQVYRDVLFHGFQLRGIEEILTYAPSGMVAAIRTAPPPDQWIADPLRSRWIGDPLVLDAAFQMAILWSSEQMGAFSLPTCFRSYRQYARSFPDGMVTAVMEIRDAAGRKLICDYTFLDGGGTVLAQLKEYQAVVDASLQEAFRKAG